MDQQRKATQSTLRAVETLWADKRRSDTERLELLDRAWALGCTNWDTADVYGNSEDIIGKWFALHPERRKYIFLATKFGLSVGNDYSISIDSSPDNCVKCFKRSLNRLNVDYIDLYYLHRPNPKVPIEETIMAMQELVRYVKYFPHPIHN